MKYEIHISDVRAFKSCRRRWDWVSPLRNNLEPNIPYMPFFTGRAIHYALDVFYSQGIPLVKTMGLFVQYEMAQMEKHGRLFESERESLQEQIELMVAILEHYEIWLKHEEGRWSDDQFEFIAMETEFSVPLRTPSGRASSRVFLAGRFDGLIMRKDDGSFWIWETKTTRSIDELHKSLANDEQCGAYVYAAQQLFDVPVTGVLYNTMRKKAPTFPKVLKDGTLSKNKSIDTTAQYYLQAVQTLFPDMSNEEILSEYRDILQHLMDEGKPFFQRIPIYRTPDEIKTLQHNLWITALEMVRPSTPLYPAPAWNTCGFCRYRSPCLALNSGKDYQFILDEEFRQRIKPTEVTLEELKDGT